MSKEVKKEWIHNFALGICLEEVGRGKFTFSYTLTKEKIIILYNGMGKGYCRGKCLDKKGRS